MSAVLELVRWVTRKRQHAANQLRLRCYLVAGHEQCQVEVEPSDFIMRSCFPAGCEALACMNRCEHRLHSASQPVSHARVAMYAFARWHHEQQYDAVLCACLLHECVAFGAKHGGLYLCHPVNSNKACLKNPIGYAM